MESTRKLPPVEDRHGKRMTPEYLREEVFSQRFRGCVLYEWMRKRHEKETGVMDWPEEDCRPPEPTANELDERRSLVKSVLALVDGGPDEKAIERLNRYTQGGYDDQLCLLLRSLAPVDPSDSGLL